MFLRASPIFLTGLHRTHDVQAGFYLPLPVAACGRITLRCTAATFYRVYLNGDRVAHGPARAAHGYARVDEIDLTAHVLPGVTHHVAIEVASYHFDCIYTTGDAGFVMAEVVCDGVVLAHTDTTTAAVRLTQRRPAERFSHARVTGEVYTLGAAFIDWRLGEIDTARLHAVERVAGPNCLMPRGVPWPDFTRHDAATVLGVYSFERDAAIQVPPIGPLEFGPYLDFLATLPERPAVECASEKPVPLRGRVHRLSPGFVRFDNAAERFGVDLDFGTLQAGFIGVDVETEAGATLDIIFVDTLGERGEIDARTGDMNGVIRLHLCGGRIRFESFEPHCFRYVRLVFGGTSSATVQAIFAVDYAYPDRFVPALVSGDAELDAIDAAARLTLRLNTLDVFMDCPGRERAGWLCDSLFTARAMAVVYGDHSVERAMLENFLNAPEAAHAPGHFPQCYPGEPIHGDCFIPNWSMFLPIELAEYTQRSGDTTLRYAFTSRIERLLVGLQGSENAHGLLEHLPGTVFVDWSAANRPDFRQPMSTPTNALYSMMLDAVGGLYDRPELIAKATKLRNKLRSALPITGYLPDALHGKGDRLVTGVNCSEAAQYYLFWCGVADPHGTHAVLWQRLLEAGGPCPASPERADVLPPSNVFIGLYLRFDLLARLGERERLVCEMKALFRPMLARGPGTLWEHHTLAGSVCHGFASHAAVWLREP